MPKLPPDIRNSIINEAKTTPVSEIAKKYNVCAPTIYKILKPLNRGEDAALTSAIKYLQLKEAQITPRGFFNVFERENWLV